MCTYVHVFPTRASYIIYATLRRLSLGTTGKGEDVQQALCGQDHEQGFPEKETGELSRVIFELR